MPVDPQRDSKDFQFAYAFGFNINKSSYLNIKPSMTVPDGTSSLKRNLACFESSWPWCESRLLLHGPLISRITYASPVVSILLENDVTYPDSQGKVFDLPISLLSLFYVPSFHHNIAANGDEWTSHDNRDDVYMMR